jgi:Na+/H+-translocating membrane pyrophosphatase
MREIAAAIRRRQGVPQSAVPDDRVVGVILFVLIWAAAVQTAGGFLVGAVLSGLTGYIG